MTITEDGLTATFAALADPTRRAILARLADGEATVNQLAEPFALTQQAVSKHLKVLEHAGLISRGRDGQRRPCRLEPANLDTAAGWIARHRQIWADRYDRLDEHLASLRAGAPGTGAESTGADGTGADGTGRDGTSANGASANGASANGASANGASANGTGPDGTGPDGTGPDGTGPDDTEQEA